MGQFTVLVVDDEPLVRRTVQRALERAGYTVQPATSGEEALGLLRSGLKPALIVSDVMMDDMIGPEFVAIATGLTPHAAVLYMSGETPENLPEVGLDKLSVAFLEKPFSPDALLDKVRDLLDEAR